MAVEGCLEHLVVAATGVAANAADLLQIVFRLEPVSLFEVPHAVVGPGACVVGIGGKRLIIPILGVVVPSELAAGIAKVGRDIRMEAVGRLASGVAATCDNLLRDVSQDCQQWLAAAGSDTTSNSMLETTFEP